MIGVVHLSRRRPRRVWSRRGWAAGAIVTLAMAVLLMHTAVPAVAAAAEPAHPGHAPTAPTPTLGAGSDPDTDSIASAQDCDGYLHGCVFIRAADVDLPDDLGIVLLVWGFAVSAPLVSRVLGSSGPPGRAPPWTVLTHLQLNVIRC